MSLVLTLVLLVQGFVHLSASSQCSHLILTPSTTSLTDENYSIVIEKLPTSNLIKVSVNIKTITNDGSWFIMGASDSSKLIGSWQPLTAADGQVLDCSSSLSTTLEQAVSNENTILESSNRLEFIFYWMAPQSFNQSVTFVATILNNNETSLRYIQSQPIQIELNEGSNRFRDVSTSFCTSSPCQNGGTCIYDTQYSYCRCVAPWNGVFCQLQYFHIMLASNQLFTSDFYFNTLNSPVYANLTSDITAWLNNAFSALPTDRIYSINFVAPSALGSYISISMALTPTTTTSYASVILSALATAITQNSTTGQGRQLSISPTYVANAVVQDSTPYTNCVFPFALVLVDYNFCIPYEPDFICSSSRVIDRNTTLASIDCSRNIYAYIQNVTCFPNMCLNGGTCSVVNGVATCTCPAYFTGSRCDELFGCNPVTNSQAITCTNGATCVNNRCVCTSNSTVGTLCEIPTTVCNFPFTFMDISYASCAVIGGQSLCVTRNSQTNGQFPVTFAACGGAQCQNNPCANRGSCQDTTSGSFRCINCASGYSGYFCELQYRTLQMTLNVTYTPDLANASSNASILLQAQINETLNQALLNITTGGFRPEISFVRNPDGTTSAIINLVTNYVNFQNNATQNALDKIGAVTVVLTNTTRECAPWYIYQGKNITGCVMDANGITICSITDNFDRDGQYTTCSEPIYTSLCNNVYCGAGECVVTSRNLTYCQCPSGVTGTNCDQLTQCTDVNCLNNGTCVLLSSNYYRCNCATGYGGTYCQYNITDCSFPFVDNQNRTHNSCITTSDYLSGTVAWCRTITGQQKSCEIDYCSQQPCVYGVCVPSSAWAYGNSYSAFTCNCTTGYTGRLCTHAYFRLKALYAVPNISLTTLNALESPTTEAYQNLSAMFRDLIRNQTNATFDFLPLIFTTFRTASGYYYQISADLSYAGNISVDEISDIITPILSNLPPTFNATYIDNGNLDPDEIQPLNPASNCTLPYEYNGDGLAVCHMDANGLAYCSYGVNYTLTDRKLCDASGLPTAQYSACENLNLTNPCNSTTDFPIRCVASDDGWTCFCEVTQTLGIDCGILNYCRNGSLLCRNNATCINRPDLADFACNCTNPYYGRLCENYGLSLKLYLVNYTNETSPGLEVLISNINQTIINMTNGSVIATSITISPSGEVTIAVTGRNSSIPEFELPLLDKVNQNWTVGPFLVAYNQTSLIPIETNTTCIFPFAYNGVNYTTCITTGYGFPWCSATPVFTGQVIDCRNINWCASGPCLNNGTCTNNLVTGSFQCNCVDGWTGVRCAYASTTITIVIPLGNNTYNNLTYIDVSNLFPNGTHIDIVRPGPNNTVIIVIITNGTAPNITIANVLNITTEPTKNVDGCVFPFTYMNSTFSTCIPLNLSHTTYCCENSNCDLNPQWQVCNTSICSLCSPDAGCTISSSGLLSCVCPVGYTGQLCNTPVDLCALNNRSCLNNGVCVINPNTSVPYCNCSSPWNGTSCEIFVPCLSNPCGHNGTCTASSTGALQCNCTNCYGGPLCEITDYCCLNVCAPNGVCSANRNNSYQCICDPNYSGVNCTIYNPCALAPCLNNGICTVLNGSYLCTCPTGYTGVNCETTVNPCASSPCLNNGQCISLGSSFVCACLSGFNGTYCEQQIDPCSSYPCLHNGVCLQQVANSSFSTTGSMLGYVCYCNSTIYTGVQCETIINPCPTTPALTPCRNGGTCVPNANGTSYICYCPYPYNGTNCDQIIDLCSSNPCAPNGLCYMNSVTMSFQCVCINSTFTGPLCQNLTNPCLSSPCTVDSTCIAVGTDYVCQCPTNRTGINCESLIPPCTNSSCFNNGTCLFSGSIVTCLCPPSYTGPQCLTPVNACSINPCLHNGTCISLSPTTYVCSCPTTWSGTVCEIFVNPCSTNPCFNDGTCLLNSTNLPNCVCPTTYTGQYCQTLISPCLSSPCVNNGTCIANSASTSYTCQCLPLYTDTRCESLVNPCLQSPCIYGTCFTLGNGTYYCACQANYTGLICDHPIDKCSLNPCVHNGTCYTNGTEFYCLCPTGYTGSLCEQIINPCSSSPCQSGTCLSTGTGYVCYCDASHTGVLCETPLDPCLSNPCFNNQTCFTVGTTLSYICLCASPYTGLRCESIILPCTGITCLNNGTCVQTTLTTTQCICPTGFTGTYCETPVSVCQIGLCLNNGTCIATSTSTFVCNCVSPYMGTYCEQYNPCYNYTCLNGGTCAISSTSVGGRICICPTGYTGSLCETPISPCSSSPCVNDGVCITVPGSTNLSCICPIAYTGVFCETYINPCLTYYCGNGGTCYRNVAGTAICACLSEYTGPQCLTIIDPCLSSPCLNNGICSSLLPIYNYTCICPTNYTGYRCENYIGGCTTTLCLNGGTCVYNGLNAVKCLCLPVWTGTLCEQRIDPCTTANPCLNSGICLVTYNGTNSTTTACQCLSTYTGEYCETPISPCSTLHCVNGQCLLRADGTAICYCNSQWTGAACDTLIQPCLSTPCLNNGICYVNGTGYACLCPTGYSGSRCETILNNQCTLACINNGTCAVRSTDNVQVCVCPTGYTGTLCEIQISPCTPSPCLNNGVCLPSTYLNGTLGFICICPAPYTGQICSDYISTVCANSTCLNGGTCYVSGNQKICQCLVYYTGTFCENLINPCDSYPCVNGGTCVTTTAMIGRKKRQTTIVAFGFACECLPSYTGTRCESTLTLCSPNPCLHNGTCYQNLAANTIHCLCTANYTGTYCNTTVNTTNVCQANPSICLNGGTCVVNATATLGFHCTCPSTATGLYCETIISGCQLTPSPCINGGTCLTTLTGFICWCPEGYTGTYCETPTNPCSSEPCFRNGTCLAYGNNSYVCVCPTGYSGSRCEICNCPCYIYPCLNGGICQSTSSGGVICVCPTGYTGVRCETSSLPCDSNPCLNGGVCLYNPITMNMTCQCCGLATGVFCETLINPCNNTIPFCFNNGTCVINSLSKPICLCPDTFTGTYCETYANPCSTVTCIHGTCVMLANSTFLCLCPTGRSGTYCEIVDQCATVPGSIAPCRNGGTCVRLTGTAYSCICPSGFTGTYCDIANPCASMPCAPNATCGTLINGSAICICPPDFTGIRCNETIPTLFCSSSPCQNNGTCNGTTCICPSYASGLTCNVTTTPCPTSSRPTLVCTNGGTCVPGYGCFCQAGYGGDDCDTILPTQCTNSTCLNGGTCLLLPNGTVICVCPTGYTGVRCQTTVSICSLNPCQNNGTCMDSGTTGYVCVCPPNFTGAQCSSVTNPCLYSPCFNGGTCVQLSTGGYTCYCTTLFTGTQCQTAANLCSPSPCNSGTCVTVSSGTGYVCYCPPQLTGPTCLIANPCGLQPCLNGGTCTVTSSSTYTCSCPINFLGTTCEIFNLCAQNPCLNNGTCTMLTSSTIACACTSAYYGDRCQYVNPCQNPICIHGLCQVNSITLAAQCACYAGWTGTYCDTAIACLSNPCVHGTCVGTSSAGYQCICPSNYTGSQCETAIIQTPCQVNPCINSGTCQITGTNSYICLCSPYYVGTHCEFINPCLVISAPASCQPVLTATGNYTCQCTTNPCSSNPCQYGTCSTSSSGLGYMCSCYSGYLGTQCNLPDPCSYIICYNGGTCVATVNNASTQVVQTCQCPASQHFVGTYCEHYNPCISAPCMNGAECTYYINVTCYYRCTCPVGFTGERCQSTLSQVTCESVNVANNCRNGATCVVIGTTPQCFCTSMHTGTYCETTIDMCSLKVCQNNGTCSVVNSTSVHCACTSGYEGQYCEYSTDPCSVKPCLNNGICIPSGLTFSCNCAQTMYTGARCQTLISSPCLSNPCLNGGTCQVVGSAYVCTCAAGYTDTTCSTVSNLCSTIQCLNGGTCTNYGSFAVCSCTIVYAGDRCQYTNQCYPSSPCSNGGTCISVLNSYSCQCPVGYTGTTCQLFSDNPCSNNFQCLNGGTCIVLSGTTKASCRCPTQYTGDNCEQNVADSTTTTTTTQQTTISQSLTPLITQAISSLTLNTTVAPYTCDDSSLACLAYESYCAPEIEFAGIPCRVLCPRTCKTCCEDFYKDGTCSITNCQLNPKLESYCRKTCICKT